MPRLIAIALLALSFSAKATAEPIVIAHRGASGVLPEHSREAKIAAYFMGADFIEQDVVLTKDGVPIILHDLTLDATTDVAEKFPSRARGDGRHYAIDFTLAEISTLGSGERRSARTGGQAFPGRYPVEDRSFRISTLNQELAMIAELNRMTGRMTGIYTELKSPDFHRAEGYDLAKTVLTALANAGYRTKDDPFFVQSFDWQEIQRLRKELGFEGKLIQLLGENDWWDIPGTDYDWLKTDLGLDAVAEIADGIGPWIGQIFGEQGQSTGLAERAAQAGLAVHAYTFRADRLPGFAGDYRMLVEKGLAVGVDGFFTDFPDQTLEVLRAR